MVPPADAWRRVVTALVQLRDAVEHQLATREAAGQHRDQAVHLGAGQVHEEPLRGHEHAVARVDLLGPRLVEHRDVELTPAGVLRQHLPAQRPGGRQVDADPAHTGVVHPPELGLEPFAQRDHGAAGVLRQEVADARVEGRRPQALPLGPRAAAAQPLGERVVHALDQLDGERIADHAVRPGRFLRAVVQRPQQGLRDAREFRANAAVVHERTPPQQPPTRSPAAGAGARSQRTRRTDITAPGAAATCERRHASLSLIMQPAWIMHIPSGQSRSHCSRRFPPYPLGMREQRACRATMEGALAVIHGNCVINADCMINEECEAGCALRELVRSHVAVAPIVDRSCPRSPPPRRRPPSPTSRPSSATSRSPTPQRLGRRLDGVRKVRDPASGAADPAAGSSRTSPQARLRVARARAPPSRSSSYPPELPVSQARDELARRPSRSTRS